MTFLAPSQRVPLRSDAGTTALSFRGARGAGRARVGDEDGARRALGVDAHVPPALLAGASVEHLARIALG